MSERRRNGGAGGGGIGSGAGGSGDSYGVGSCSCSERAPSLRRSSSRVRLELERADGWSSGSSGGGGSAGEIGYRSDDGWSGEWDDEIEYLSSFGFNGGHGDGDSDSDGYHGHGMVAGGSGGGDAMASLSERDAARLEEVGIMVKELEGGNSGGGGAGESAAAVMIPPSSALPSSDAAGGDGGGEDELGMAPRMRHFVGGAPMDNARLRMSCGDPVFFGQLAEIIEGVHRESGGRKFLSHAEEMELGVKVQRYRRLIEVREDVARGGECTHDAGRKRLPVAVLGHLWVYTNKMQQFCPGEDRINNDDKTTAPGAVPAAIAVASAAAATAPSSMPCWEAMHVFVLAKNGLRLKEGLPRMT